MTPLKKQVVVLTIVLLGISFPIFLVTGYSALYWAWVRDNLTAALPLLPWARNFGMLAVATAALALVILFSSRTFPIPPNVRLWLSFLVTATIGFFAEFRNDGKFYFKRLVHFFGPGTWSHDGLNRIVPSTGDFLYRLEYSHWNDFLMGPAIVSVLFFVAFIKVYGTFRNQGSTSISASGADLSPNLDGTLQFARTLMNVGLFWFLIQAWAEKAGYIRNPHSNDELDLPFEFAGTMLGFWMARILTKPFDERSEIFRSTLLIDFVCSGVIGLLYTFTIGPLTEGVASSIAHSLSPVVPHSLDVHEYTPLQQHIRPFELLLLAGTMWWGLNRAFRHDEIPQLTETSEEPESSSRWEVLITLTKPLVAITGYLLILAAMLSVLEPEGLGWTLATAGLGIGVGTAALLLVRRAGQHCLTIVFSRHHEPGE